jgi:hypothetical protein
VAELRRAYGQLSPKAIESLERDWARMITYYAFPWPHWRHLRTCVAAGLWGAWRPATTRASIRAVRTLLFWVALMSVLLCLGLPLTARATMTR